jgi:hypothetical protein
MAVVVGEISRLIILMVVIRLVGIGIVVAVLRQIMLSVVAAVVVVAVAHHNIVHNNHWIPDIILLRMAVHYLHLLPLTLILMFLPLGKIRRLFLDLFFF